MGKRRDKAADSIVVKGARVNNLKSIDVSIPRDKLVVITGVSGSGKSSLAFDTLYAEGQRRYVESLSAYARQFLGRMGKPECDYIKGLPPAIAIEQRTNTRNSRSTVGTSTELYEYLRLLYARIGKTVSPTTGGEVKQHQVNDVMEWVLSFATGTRFEVYAPVVPPEGRTLVEQLEILRKEGYTRLSVNGEVCRIQEALDAPKRLMKAKQALLLIDRLTVDDDKALRNRAADSIETAFYEGGDVCIVSVYGESGVVTREFSKRFEADGIVFETPTEQMFSFNNPLGACPACEGFGKVTGIDEDLVIPNKNLSVYDGAVACWKGIIMDEWRQSFIRESETYGFPIHRPYRELTEEEKSLLWHGGKGLRGIDRFFDFVTANLHKVQYRVMQARFRGKMVCPQCKGSRLKPQALYVQVGGKNIAELVCLPVVELKGFFDQLSLSAVDAAIAQRILTEIRSRLQFLIDVGLGYLTLDRPASSLSGGESQRINLVTSLGSSLVGSLYILDEPSIGLHARDTHLLIGVLRRLQALGNTVIVVEHDEEIIRAADYIIDIGPKAGRLGGEVVYQGDVANLQSCPESLTVSYLTGAERIETPAYRRPWNSYIEVKGARKNNLKGIDVKFPLNVMTVVTGVSGSGKSTLVRDVFYQAVKRRMEYSLSASADCEALEGDIFRIHAIDFVDQGAVGKSARSNPVIYIGAYDYIRQLFANQPSAYPLGYNATAFSFNKEGGRCEECKGEGFITVEMQFMADLTLPCEACHGKRFNPDVLEITYRDANIYDVLEMTVEQSLEFFAQTKGGYEQLISRRLQSLQDVGLGYVKLGQPSSTLSGGENQRLKLASFLAADRPRPSLFIFDEPTTGLHFHDIKTLLAAFNALTEKGHTLIIIEHNMEIIKCADHVIDLGPEGGEKGGTLVCAGTPEDLARCPQSHTGRALQNKLSPSP